jgi:hypothetical protein
MSEQHPEPLVALSSDRAPERPSGRATVRSRAIWLLAVGSLLPGVVAVVAREFFHGLPYSFRVTVYVLSALMMAAVVVLILTQKESA